MRTDEKRPGHQAETRSDRPGCGFSPLPGRINRRIVLTGTTVVHLMSNGLDAVRAGSAMLGVDTEVIRAREHRPLSRGSSDGPQPYQGRPSVGPVPRSRCGPATLCAWRARWPRASKLTARMDCIVTGGAGFIGSNLVDALVEPRRSRHRDRQSVDRKAVEPREALERGATLASPTCATPRRRRDLQRRASPSSCSIWPPRSTSATRSSTLPATPRQRARARSRCSRRPASGRRATGGQHVDRRRSVRRRRGPADAGGPSDPAAGPLRPGQVRRRGLLRAVHPAARPLDRLAALWQRLRPAPGRPRRGRRRGDLLRRPVEGARRPCSATGARRAIGSTCATSCAPTCWPPSPADRSGQHRPRAGDLGARPDRRAQRVSASARCSGSRVRARATGRGTAELPRRESGADELGWEAQVELRDGLRGILATL